MEDLLEHIESDFKYVVINTGYMDRLLDEVPRIEKKIKKKLGTDNNVLYIDYYVDYKIYHNICEALMVYNGAKEYAESGIAIKCDGFIKLVKLLKILMSNPHCAMFHYHTIMDVKLVDNILILEFDCESG